MTIRSPFGHLVNSGEHKGAQVVHYSVPQQIHPFLQEDFIECTAFRRFPIRSENLFQELADELAAPRRRIFSCPLTTVL
jgi:hypothetical protein